MSNIPQYPKYPTPWTGPEFEEGIMRILTADLEKFAWLWIDTDEGPCDLNGVKKPGCYVVLDYQNGVPGYDTMIPLSIMVEYHDDILYQIVFIGPDCWYRYYTEETDVWTEWMLKIEHPIHKDKTPPENPYDGQVWLRIPDGEWYEYILYRYDAESGEWQKIWGDEYMTHAVYDPQHYHMDMFQYFNLSLKEQMGVLTKHDCDIVHELYKSEFYSTVSHMLHVDNHYYFLLNPEVILSGDTEITPDQFWILDYVADEHNVVELNEVIGSKVDGNARQFIYMKDGSFFVRLSNGEVYYSTDLHTWINAVNSVSTHEYLARHTHEELTEYTHEELTTLASVETKFPPIDYMEKLDDERLYLFGNDGSTYFRTPENIMLLYGEKILPSDFLVHSVVAWKDAIFIAGHMRNGDPCPVYYYSLDECRTVKSFTLPVSRKWTKLYFTEDFMLISTDDAGSEFEKNTYYTIDPNLTVDNVRVASNKTLASEYNKFEKAGNKHDIHELLWLPYKKELGGGHVSDTGGILIEIVITEEKLPVIQYVESHYEDRIRTTYNFLTRYYYKDLIVYTYDEIKYIASRIVSAMERIEFGEYQEGGIDIKTFGSMSDDTYGFIFNVGEDKLGFQTVRFETFYETFKWHINDWDRHLTAKEREFVFQRVTRETADAIINKHRDTLQKFVDLKKEDFELDEELKDIADVAGAYVTHIQNKSIHVTPEQKAKWNNKADGDHTHFLDGKVKVTIEDFVQGVFSPDRFPPEAFRKIITVKNIPSMLMLHRDDIRNGSTVRVYDPETMDLTMMPAGRLFMVINDQHLNLMSSYLEYTLDFHNAYLYYWAITDKPTTRDGFELEDVYTKSEVDDLVSFGSKLNYGFETMDAGDIKHIMDGYNKLIASKDFIKDNAINISKDMTYLNQNYEDTLELPKYDPLKEFDTTKYLDFQTWFSVPYETKDRSIYNLIYIEELKMYYVCTLENGVAGIYKTDFTSAMEKVYLQSGDVDKLTYAQNCNVIYLTKNYLLFMLNGKFVLHNTAGVNTEIFDPYIRNCYYIEHGDDDYAVHIIYVDTERHLHFSSITTKCELEDMKFSHVIDNGKDMDIGSLSYSNGTIIIDMYNSSGIETWMYCHMSRFLRSSEWFDDVNIYLGNDEPIPFSLAGYTDLPQITKKVSNTRIIYQYQDPHCVNLRKDQGYSYTATYLVLEKTLSDQYYLRSRMLYYDANKELTESVRDIIEITPASTDSIYWKPSSTNTMYIPLDEHSYGIIIYGVFRNGDTNASRCQFIKVNVKDNTVDSRAILFKYNQTNAICRCSDGFIYFLGDKCLVAKHSVSELLEHWENPNMDWNGNIIYTTCTTLFTDGLCDGDYHCAIHINSVMIKPNVMDILKKKKSGGIYDYTVYYSSNGDIFQKNDLNSYPSHVMVTKSGPLKGIRVYDEDNYFIREFARDDSIVEIVDVGSTRFLRNTYEEFILIAYLYKNTSDQYILAGEYIQTSGEYGTEYDKLWHSIPNVIIPGIENPDMYTVYKTVEYLECYVRTNESTWLFTMNFKGIELREIYYSRVCLSYHLAIKTAMLEGTQRPIPYIATVDITGDPKFGHAKWLACPELESTYFIKAYDINMHGMREYITIALGNANEILIVSHHRDTVDKMQFNELKSYQYKSFPELLQIVDMYVMTDTHIDSPNNYHVIIFLLDKYGRIYYSPFWTDTWTELYSHNRYILGTHSNSIYQSIEDSINSIEDSL